MLHLDEHVLTERMIGIYKRALLNGEARVRATKRLLDIVVASVGLTMGAPLLLAASLGVKLCSSGPILYRARRMGRDRRRVRAPSESSAYQPDRRVADYGREFTMYKFRTMHANHRGGDPITARHDARVFPFGAWLRATKIDELPQLVNVLKGDMSLVGPRPEAPEIVRAHYTADDMLTLKVPPGITSPGTIYYYAHGEKLLEGDRVMERYVEQLLPVKMALDRVYLRRGTVLYDVRLILRTMNVIIGRALGRQRCPDMPELVESGVRLESPRASRVPVA